MMRCTIGGKLDMDALARMHFHALDQDQQVAAIRRLAIAGQSVFTIAQATGLSVEMIRLLLGEPTP